MEESITLGGLVALWGALTGTIAIVISYLNFKRDSIQIKLEVKKDWKVLNSPIYKSNEIYTSLSVYNKGRRPVTITKAGYVFLNVLGGAILSDSMINGSKLLQEGQSVEYLVVQKDIDFSNIEYFSAYDAVGNTYKINYAPFYKRWIYKLLHITYIKRKRHLNNSTGSKKEV